MIVEVMLFAGLREPGGPSCLTLDVPEGATFGDLRQQIEQAHPRLAPLLGFCRFAQGSDMVAEGEPVDAERKIALIPPVSGG